MIIRLAIPVFISKNFHLGNTSWFSRGLSDLSILSFGPAKVRFSLATYEEVFLSIFFYPRSSAFRNERLDFSTEV